MFFAVKIMKMNITVAVMKVIVLGSFIYEKILQFSKENECYSCSKESDCSLQLQ